MNLPHGSPECISFECVHGGEHGLGVLEVLDTKQPSYTACLNTLKDSEDEASFRPRKALKC